LTGRAAAPHNPSVHRRVAPSTRTPSRRDALRRALAGAVAVVLAVASFVSGRSYLYCVPMEAVVEACCMSTPDDPSDLTVDHAAPAVKGECCDTHAVGDLPIARGGAPGVELPAAVLTVATVEPASSLPAPVVARAIAPARVHRGDPIRAGPGSGLERLIALSVFRC
jgi:hypothetical protein